MTNNIKKRLQKEKIYFKYFKNVADKDLDLKKRLYRQINEVLTSAWGDFPSVFVKDHVLRAQRLMFAFLKTNDEVVGFCSTRCREIAGKKIHYVEFLVVKYLYQTQGIGLRLSRSIMLRILFSNMYRLITEGIHIMFISPNLRVLARSMEIASVIYPDPRLADNDGKIPEADDTLWAIAQEVLRTSQDPNRPLRREGLVLEKSYVETPWLIYSGEDIPWHHNKKLNDFAKRYIGYGKREDKEWMVYMHITVRSFLRYGLRELKKVLSNTSRMIQ